MEKKKIIYCFPATNMPLRLWGLGGEEILREFQRGQVCFPCYLHSCSLAGCFLLPASLNVHSV